MAGPIFVMEDEMQMCDIKQMVENINYDIDEIVEMFYQQKRQNAYKKLECTLSDMIQLMEEVSLCRKEQEVEFNVVQLLNALRETLKAMEEKDDILLADILKYEVQEKLTELIGAIEK